MKSKLVDTTIPGSPSVCIILKELSVPTNRWFRNTRISFRRQSDPTGKDVKGLGELWSNLVHWFKGVILPSSLIYMVKVCFRSSSTTEKMRDERVSHECTTLEVLGSPPVSVLSLSPTHWLTSTPSEGYLLCVCKLELKKKIIVSYFWQVKCPNLVSLTGIFPDYRIISNPNPTPYFVLYFPISRLVSEVDVSRLVRGDPPGGTTVWVDSSNLSYPSVDIDGSSHRKYSLLEV